MPLIYIKGLKELYKAGDLKFPGNTGKYGTSAGFNRLIKIIRKKKWSGYAKSPCSGPEKVLEYLGRYTQRVAISKGGCLEYFLKMIFDLKQFTANKMAACHTGEVRLETGNIAPDLTFILKLNNMRKTISNNLGHFLKNNFIFSLRRQKTGDINPIVKINASGPDQRHCSTTFYH